MDRDVRDHALAVAAASAGTTDTDRHGAAPDASAGSVRGNAEAAVAAATADALGDEAGGETAEGFDAAGRIRRHRDGNTRSAAVAG